MIDTGSLADRLMKESLLKESLGNAQPVEKSVLFGFESGDLLHEAVSVLAQPLGVAFGSAMPSPRRRVLRYHGLQTSFVGFVV